MTSQLSREWQRVLLSAHALIETSDDVARAMEIVQAVKNLNHATAEADRRDVLLQNTKMPKHAVHAGKMASARQKQYSSGQHKNIAPLEPSYPRLNMQPKALFGLFPDWNQWDTKEEVRDTYGPHGRERVKSTTMTYQTTSTEPGAQGGVDSDAEVDDESSNAFEEESDAESEDESSDKSSRGDSNEHMSGAEQPEQKVKGASSRGPSKPSLRFDERAPRNRLLTYNRSADSPNVSTKTPRTPPRQSKAYEGTESRSAKDALKAYDAHNGRPAGLQ